MARNIVIAGNWKMHKTNSEALQLANQIKMKTAAIQRTKIIICPPFTALAPVFEITKESKVGLGAQDTCYEKEGAFTSAISAGMIKSTGAAYVIIGHSERREYFGDNDEIVNKKIKTALEYGLNPIVCVGESLEEREQNMTMKVVSRQAQGALNGLSAEDMKKIIIAYEPVWAIGTGKTATPEQAQEVHQKIRQLIAEQFTANIAENLIIQYGGSVKPDNAQLLLGQKDIDGALVGGACLTADSFSEIINIAERLQ
jgi:triosephosphate isomerase